MPDLFIPRSLDNLFQKRVSPTLQSLGVAVPKGLGAMIRDVKDHKIWPVSIRRPLAGSVLVPEYKGRNYRAKDVIVRFPHEKRESRDDAARIDSVFGISAVAAPAAPGSELSVAWEDHRLLAVEIGPLTVLAEVLPGHDVFVAINIWANSLLPMWVLANRPLNSNEFVDEGEGIRLIAPEAFDFCTVCSKCEGGGQQRCTKCGGSGRWQPDGNCRKCGGAGVVTCPKRGRSGQCIGQYGEVLGHCRICNGSGRATCNKCDGSGEPPILTCPSCDGTGHEDCFPCHGEGSIRVSFHLSTGEFNAGGKPLAPEQVFAIDTVSHNRIPLNQGANSFLANLAKRADLVWIKEQEIRGLQLEIGRIDHCLERAMQVGGITGKEVKFRVRLGKARTSTKRLKGRHVLEFPIIGRPLWLKHNEEPLPLDTPLIFLSDEVLENNGDHARSVPGEQIERVSGRLQEDVNVSFFGVADDERGRFFQISLPREIEPDDFPDNLWVKADVVKPSELTQQAELAEWCRPYESPDILTAFVPNTERSIETPPRINPISPHVRDNPAQREALDLILSGEPLVLVKGPPGTGKTTLITELILQSIARGERVLVSSETHQAVSNVLERLHKNGGIRMVRHAREGNSKLTDLERDYLEAGSRHGFLDRVKDRSEQVLVFCKERGTSLALLRGSLQDAKTASATLANIRYDLDKRVTAARNHCEETMAVVNDDETSGLTNLDKESTQQRQSRESEIRECGKRHDRAAKLRDKALKGRDKAAVAYRKKVKKDPEWIESQRLDWKIDLSGLVPYRFMDPELIADYWSRYEDGRVAAEREITEQEARMKTVLAEIEEVKSLHERDFGELRDNARHGRALAIASLVKKLAKLREERSAAEKKFREPQKIAAEKWEQSSFAGIANEDNTESEWEQRLNEVERAIVRNTEEAEFFGRWQLSVESATGELTGLFWQTCQVFLSTCVGMRSWRSFYDKFGKDGVQLAVIDEAAHATLTQTLIPMGRAKQVVLIGDEMQLPPAPPMELRDDCKEACKGFPSCKVAQSKGTSRFKPPMSSCWLERSAFEWLMETSPNVPRVMLNKQFRMHPDIADFVADIFYEGKLATGVAAAERTISFGEFTKSICLISTSNYKDRVEEQATGESTSYRNPLEARLVERVLSHAADGMLEDAEFGIVTPYKAQRELLVKSLGSYLQGDGRVKMSEADIASVDSFQGSERDVMIASLVRSPKKCQRCDGRGTKQGGKCPQCYGKGFLGSKLRWVHDLRRLNVAFSRARKMLVLIGDIEVLTDPRYGTSEGSEVLRRFRDHVLDRGRVLQLWEEASHE
ncbi:MAG: AAA family ATPase [Akkermansiaceae bacterium]|nr:AAA family ATPase [Akkermansiaceae bacterium]